MGKPLQRMVIGDFPRMLGCWPHVTIYYIYMVFMYIYMCIYIYIGACLNSVTLGTIIIPVFLSGTFLSLHYPLWTSVWGRTQCIYIKSNVPSFFIFSKRFCRKKQVFVHVLQLEVWGQHGNCLFKVSTGESARFLKYQQEVSFRKGE